MRLLVFLAVAATACSSAPPAPAPLPDLELAPDLVCIDEAPPADLVASVDRAVVADLTTVPPDLGSAPDLATSPDLFTCRLPQAYCGGVPGLCCDGLGCNKASTAINDYRCCNIRGGSCRDDNDCCNSQGYQVYCGVGKCCYFLNGQPYC